MTPTKNIETSHCNQIKLTEITGILRSRILVQIDVADIDVPTVETGNIWTTIFVCVYMEDFLKDYFF